MGASRLLACALVSSLLAGCIDAGLSRCASGRVCAAGYRCHDELDRCLPLAAGTCGDLLVTESEECDDGNQLSHDGCSSRCSSEMPTWRKIGTGVGARDRHAMAYDAFRGRVVVYGGVDANGVTVGDTREWDGSMWHVLAPATSPPARHSAAMAYDPQTRTVLLFGGRAGQTLFADTWQWDGTTWQQLAATSSQGPRYWHAMATDSQQQRVLSFGGGVDASSPEGSDQMLRWSGTDWSFVGTQAAEGRVGAAMTSYDRGAFMFGGYSFQRPLADTWQWVDGDWTPIQATGPSARSKHAMAYEGAGRVVLYGGTVMGGLSSSDTWLWDGSRWTHLGVSDPGIRNEHRLAYDAVRRTTVLVGGVSTGTMRLDDLWTFRFERDGEQYETCVAGEDADGDMRSACADPDCWGVCTPSCPPTVMADPCDMSLPRCGDGTCNPNLEIAACPEDCP